MGVLITSRLRVTHFGSELENQCMHDQHNSCYLPASGHAAAGKKNPALGEQNTKAHRIIISDRKGIFDVLLYWNLSQYVLVKTCI